MHKQSDNSELATLMKNTPPPKSKIQKIEVYLKSGHTILVECEDCEFIYNSLLDEYIGYSFKGLVKPKRLGFNCKQISGWIKSF